MRPATISRFGFPQTACTCDNTPLLRNRSISRIISDRFRLERRIASGGMGTVYEALDLHLNRRVAIKIIAPPMGVPSGK